MISKTIEFENLDGDKVTRTFWFNLNKAELSKLQLSQPGGYQAYVQKAIEAQDTKTVIELFDELLSKAYGIRSEDGISFLKPEDAWFKFQSTDAYSELFVELLSNPLEAGKFFGGIVPRDMQATVTEAINKEVREEPELKTVEVPALAAEMQHEGPKWQDHPQEQVEGAVRLEPALNLNDVLQHYRMDRDDWNGLTEASRDALLESYKSNS